MIVTCAGCGTKYRVTEEKVGPQGVRVRCPKCRTVFEVRRQTEAEPETLAQKLFGKGVVTKAPGEPSTGPEREVSRERGKPPKPEAAEVLGPPARGKAEPAKQAPEAREEPRAEGRAAEAPPPVTPTRVKSTEPPVVAAGEASVTPAPEYRPASKPPEPPGEAQAPESAAEESAGAEKKPFPFAAGEEDPRTLARALVSDILFYHRVNRDRGLAEGKLLAYLGKEIARSWETYRERLGLEKALEEDHFREAVNEILGEGKRVL